jgi:twitching motility protein PilT
MVTEKFLSLVDEVISQELSDLHLTTGDVPYIRTHTGILNPVRSFETVDATMMKDMVRIILQGRDLEGKTVDCSYLQKNRRFRVNISQNVRGISISMRSIPTRIPTPEDVSLSRSAMNLFKKEKGIILVTGPTGSGKTTTLAAMIEHLNQTEQKHIITLEDPIEFVFKNKKALVHQREK